MKIPMRVLVNADDHETLQRYADTVTQPLEVYAGVRLAASLRQLPPTGRVVVLSGAPLEQMETILGGGSILNQDDLQRKVERLAGVSFLHCRLPFTPNQLEQLAEKAGRNGQTVEQLVERTAPRIYEQFFDLMARSTH